MGYVDDSVRRKRRHEKVKTGCITCRRRRIKCDENTPTCLNCTWSHRMCEGYTPQAMPWLFKAKPANTNLCLMPRPALSTVQNYVGTAQNWNLHYYFYKTGPWLGAVNPTTQRFWQYLVPQIGQSDPIVSHLMAALVANHESIEQNDRKDQRHSIKSMKHYSIALALLSKYGLQLRADLMMMISMMMMAYETVRSPPLEGAIFHLNAMVKLLRNLPGSGYILEQMGPMLKQFRMLLTTFNMPTSQGTIKQEPLEESPFFQMPSKFDDITHARNLLQEMFRYRFKGDKPWHANSPHFLEMQSHFQQFHTLAVDLHHVLPTDSFDRHLILDLITTCGILLTSLRHSVQPEVVESEQNRPFSLDLSNKDEVVALHEVSKVTGLQDGYNACEAPPIRSLTGIAPRADFFNYPDGRRVLKITHRL